MFAIVVSDVLVQFVCYPRCCVEIELVLREKVYLSDEIIILTYYDLVVGRSFATCNTCESL